MNKERKCDVCGVSSEQKRILSCSKHNMCLCSKHYAQIRKYGKIVDPTTRTIKDKNEIILHDDYAELIIRNKVNDVVAKALIDLEDVERVSTKKWNVVPDKRHVYIYTKTPKHIKLHRFVLNYYGNMEIDHINHDTLDNRKSNLRVVTRSENASNTMATCIHTNGKVWYFDMVRFGKRFSKSGFKTYEEAEAAIQKCKQDISARVNELLDEYNEQHKRKYPGVYYHHEKYQAIYCIKGKRYYLGVYKTAEEANAAREKFIEFINDPNKAC